MSITLTFTGNESVLNTNYFPPIELKGNYVCGSISLDTYHSIPNVDLHNNKFHIGNYEITIPVGSYEIDDITDLIIIEYEEKKKENNILSINANYNTLQTEIISKKDIIYFNKENSIGKLLGFTPKILQTEIKNCSDNPINITKINNIIIKCNIIAGTYINNTPAHILHQFALAVSPGYKITEIPQNVIYLPVNTQQINSIILEIVDQDDNLINFRGEKITIRLHLKPLKE